MRSPGGTRRNAYRKPAAEADTIVLTNVRSSTTIPFIVKIKYPALPNKVLLQFSWRRGAKGSRGQGFKGLFSKDFISAFNILSISAILEGIETTDLLICEVRPYLSSFGNFAVIFYISKQSLYAFCQTFKSL